ncbi:type VI secretion system Vgr family protein [Helicobacter sp. MIT 14-3879]|uniref:type VI secretion system Vgr family protein n=1 Tax=Helicobacter sp. MIT 14-3879 TaxID=2040649 RepID=UPI000E1EE4CD|nr:contractile injection system protein, VgrG/Pvc8 family [Helicobacter sp. MIT 14-3879]RDU61191.1 type VI secretion protein VgrG [Helicobacter sp. MIT 14-3879]
MSLDISNPASNPLPFKITKAIIKESFEELFSIECEGFFESLDESLFNLSQDFNFHPNVLIDQEAILSIHNPYENNTLNFDTNEVKNYKGIITYIKYLGINQESTSNINDSTSNTKQLKYKHFFSFKLESVLIRLSLNKANRIYTHTNIIEVIKQTLHFYQDILHKQIDYSNMHFNYEEQELISQYNESDLEFITRLAHNNGIFFYEDENAIYFCDVYKNTKSKEIEYNPNINNALNQACISSIYKEQSLRTNSFTHSSINANTPLNLLSLHSNKVAYEQELNNKAYYNEHFYESEYSFTKNIDLKTKPSLKEKRALVLNESFLAKSNIYHLSLGDFITLNYEELNLGGLSDEDTKSQDNTSLLKDFIVIANTQILIDDAILANSINTNDHLNLKDLNLSKSYSNTLTLLKKNIIFTPSFKAKPKAPNSTQGIVIGESKDIESERNTIYTDEYGRVKVRINLYANQEELDENLLNANIKTNIHEDTNNTNSKDNTSLINSSNNLSNDTYKSYHHTPFLRVATGIASNHSGFYHTPRVGDEVIISFLDDDIDKPYVSGSLYNGTNASLVNLPFNDHQTSISSKTIGTNEEGFNELTLSNIKDKEQIYLKAQKDYDELVQHNFTQRILNDKDSIVDGIYNERIKKAHTQTIDLAKNVNVGGEYLTNVALSKDTIVGLSNTLNVGVDNKTRIAKNSSEFIGENKDIEIGANQNTIIHKDEIRNVKGNREEVTEGKLELHVNKGMNYFTQEHFSMQTSNYIDIYTEQNLSTQTKKQHTELAESKYSDFQTDYEVKAGNQIIHKVGDTTITTNQNCVIIKAGGVEVIIDSNGLVVKGGEIKAE